MDTSANDTLPDIIEEKKCASVPRCILDQKQRLKTFCILTSRELKASLVCAPVDFINCICEIVYNVVFGFLPVSEKTLNEARRTKACVSDLHRLAAVHVRFAKWRRLNKRSTIFKRRTLLKAIIQEVLVGVKNCK